MKIDYSAGTYERIVDFGVAGVAEFKMMVDVDELADTSYQVDVYTRETETDGWWPIGGTGSQALDTNGVFTLERYRYVKIAVTTTGSDFPSGVTGY